MLTAIRKPLAAPVLALSSVGILVAVAVYCFAYNALSGRSESLIEGVRWAAVNVLPWFLGFEAAKRAAGGAAKAAALAAALLGSILLHLILFGLPAEPAFQLVRRLPGLILIGLLLLLVELPKRREGSLAAELPLLPGQIDWVAAAGNYVELHSGPRTILHRASLAATAAELDRHGFVRIHRSILVRRSAIGRIRRVDLLLKDGTSLKIGSKYRSSLVDAAPDFRPFVPAE
jgi:hypothetical protein